MTTGSYTRDRRIVGGLLVLSLLLVSCGKVTIVRQEEVEDRINREIPVGSRSSEVIAFLDALSINGIKAEHLGYVPGKPMGTEEMRNLPRDAKGHIWASMKRTATDHSNFQVYSIWMTFYFDEGERLIAHKISTLGDW